MSKERAYELIHACFQNLETAAELVRAQPDLLMERTGIGETPLHFLAVEDQVAAVRLLHEAGAEINTTNDFGASALAEALSVGAVRTAAYLLESGADVNARDANGESCLHAAVRSGSEHLVKLVLARIAAVNLPDSLGETPLHTAVMRDSSAIARLLLSAGADPNVRRIFDETVLHVAARSGSLESVKVLVNNGADLAALEQAGRTAAQLAREYGHEFIAEYLETVGGAA